MVDPAVLPGYLLAALLIAIAPGPDNSFIAAVALERGARAGVLSAIGMALGMVVHVTAAAVGLAVLLRSSPAALEAIRLAGAAYLAWLARGALASVIRGRTPARSTADRRGTLLRAVLTNLSNPKVVLFFAALLPQFARPGHGPLTLQFLTLGALFLLVGLCCDTAVGLLAGRLHGTVGDGRRAAAALKLAAGFTYATLAALLLAETIRG